MEVCVREQVCVCVCVYVCVCVCVCVCVSENSNDHSLTLSVRAVEYSQDEAQRTRESSTRLPQQPSAMQACRR